MQKCFITKKMIGFTLAEVLITLTIVGVIAALTIPNLIAKHEEQETVAKLKKAYSILSTAQKLSISDSGYDYDSLQNPYNAFKNYLKIAKDCGTTGSGCMVSASEYKSLGGKTQSGVLGFLDDGWTKKVLLDDGIAVAFLAQGYGYVAIDNTNRSTGYIIVDVNGIKPPNIFGKDTFMFVVTHNKIVPMGLFFNEQGYTCRLGYCNVVFCSTKNANSPINGMSCTGWVITKGNMDYLRRDISADN